MSESSSSDLPPTRASQRIPLETRVRLEFERFQGFVEEYSSNLSLGGMFIRTGDPKPRGTLLEFELALQEDDFTLIQGSGEVVWVRERDDGEAQPAGMGIRFRELDPRSEELILRMVRTHLDEGGRPFELYPVHEGEAAAEGAAAEHGRGQGEVLDAPDLDELFSDDPAATPSPGLAGREGPPPGQDEVAAGTDRPVPQTEKEVEAVSELRRFLSGSKRRRQRRRRRLVAAAALLALAGAAAAVAWHWEELSSRLVPGGEPAAAVERAPDRAAGPPPGAEAPADAAAPPPPEAVGEPEPPPDRQVVTRPEPEPEALAPTEPVAVRERAPPAPVAAIPATAVEEIAWEEVGGEFRLRLRGNGLLDVDRAQRFRLDGENPRELVRIRGIERPYRETVVPVASELVSRVRTGFHQRPAGPELHIVLDLTRGDLPQARLEQRGADAELRLARD